MSAALDVEQALELATRAAREAGALLLERFGAIHSFERKSSRRDLVTEADLHSERLLVARLRAAFPDHAIEAEEEVRDPLGEPSVPRWFIDPLDGTINYFHGLPLFAVSIGLWRDGLPEAAVVHAPRLDETFTAARGRGARLNGEPIAVSDTSRIDEAILATGFPYRRGELANDNLRNFTGLFHEVRGLRRMGSAALDLAYTACGRFDGFWELHLAPHDVAAGALLVREAGGLVTDAEGGQEWLRGGHIVAAGPALQPLLRDRIEP